MTQDLKALPTLREAPPRPAGPEITLDKGAAWLAAHEKSPCFVWLRLRDLARGGRDYDTALSNLDRKLGTFLEHLGTLPLQDNLVIAITSPYALDPAMPAATPALSEPVLHVPLMIYVPGDTPKRRAGPVSLEDLAPTLLLLAKSSFPHECTGANLFDFSRYREPIAIAGDPLVFSIRTKHCRYTWDSGREPFTYTAREQDVPIELIDMDTYHPGEAPLNTLGTHPALAELCRDRLLRFLRDLEKGKDRKP